MHRLNWFTALRNVSVHVFFLLLAASFQATCTYAGGGFYHVNSLTGHSQRNIDLIDRLSGTVRFDVEGAAAASNQTVQMTDHLGKQYNCKLGNKTADVKGSPPRRNGDDGFVSRPGSRNFSPSDPEQQLQQIAGVCAEFPLGWWTYRWCHKKQVTQFHKDADGSVGKTTSIGIFDPKLTKVVEPPSKPVEGEVVGATLTYFFTKGNAKGCSDAEVGRTTTVTLSCCGDPGSPPQGGGGIKMSSFKEPEPCKYEFRLCSTFLCERSGRAAAQRAKTVHQLLKPLENVCMQKHEGWWTYEFCYRQHVRQVHLQAVANKNGKRETKVVSEYVLGKFDGRKETAGNEVEGPESIVPSLEDPARKAFAQDYSQGHKCGITGQTRSTRVYFVCKPGTKTTFLVSVKEERTCHYVMVVNAPVLCEHSLFQVTADSSRELVCSLQQGKGKEAETNGGKQVEVEIDARGSK